MSSQMFRFVFVLAALLSISSCTRTAPSSTPVPASPTPAAKKFSPADLAKLRWIEGSWRGTGDVEAPFYERYHFENDSTLSQGSMDYQGAGGKAIEFIPLQDVS